VRQLEVIGAGLSRTGTMSLKLALERLGFGPCYHMHEVGLRPEHAARWLEAAAGATVDWTSLLGGYSAAVDAPTSHFWRQLSATFPAAKVILTVRDAAAWYQSVRSTIYELARDPDRFAAPGVRAQLELARTITFEGAFGGRFEDEQHALTVFTAHNDAVRESLTGDRLLVFDVAAGWGPLCRFLARPIPEGPFPRRNGRAEFRRRAGLSGSS